MRFLADMGISTETVAFLRARGHEAIHLREQGLQRMKDADILQIARDEKRILLAHDLDFSDLMAASGARLPSVVIFRLRSMRPANVNLHLQAVLEAEAEALRTGAVISVREGQIRVRRLPLSP